MNYHDIKHDDMLNGDGIRVTLFVSGCEHHCKNCQNQKTWSYNSGIPFDVNAEAEILGELRKDYISGITFSGGDPLAPKNRQFINTYIHWIRREFPNKTIWLYTGYKFDQLVFEGNFLAVDTLKNCDVVVDGKYIEELRDVSLKWRGSKNQRVIDVKRSFEQRKVVLWCD